MSETQIANSTTALATQAKELRELHEPLLQMCREFKVTNSEEYTQAQSFAKDLKAAMERVNRTFNPRIKEANDKHKELIRDKNDLFHPLDLTCNALTLRARSWKDEQERLQKLQQEQLQAAAQRQEEERRLQEALAKEQAGEHEAAEEIISEEPPPIAIVLPSAIPKVPGISFRENWHAEVTDLMALVKAVAEEKVPIIAIQANMVHLNEQARSLKQLLKKQYPGVKAVSETIQNTSKASSE